ncbi:MAG: SDR family NAD(P)-dependent oxidoreductase [Candidatus Bipolaricaulia bacterium]
MTYQGISIAGKVAVVIGGTGGIGQAIALGMVREGASVIPTSRNLDRVKQAVNLITQHGGRSLVCPVDTTDEASLQELRTNVIEEFGRVDILVNSAGIHLRKPTIETTEAEWNTVLDINLTGPFLACKVIGQTMITQGRGKIINVASVASFVSLFEAPAYCASKAGLLQLTRSLAQEWARYNVNVNAIVPGFFLTLLNREILEKDPERRSLIEGKTPMGRLGDAEELVGAAVYLASDAADFVTGAAISVDGGFLTAGV